MIYDFYHDYQSYKLAPSKVHVRVVFNTDMPTIVVMSELKHNPGPSITNSVRAAVESIRDFLSKNSLVDGEPMLWVEHYCPKAVYNDPKDKDTYDLVSIDTPTVAWKHCQGGIDDLAALSGHDRENFVIAEHLLSATF